MMSAKTHQIRIAMPSRSKIRITVILTRKITGKGINLRSYR